MGSRYFCANCNEEFTTEQAERRPRCPKCMRRSGIEAVRPPAAMRSPLRQLVLLAAIALAAAGIGYGVYRHSTVTLQERPPERPLEPRELAAYLKRDQVAAGPYESMFVLPERVEGWPQSPSEIAKRMNGESSRWPLEQTLRREVLTAEETLALMAAQQDRVELYPLEMAVAMTALLRQRGIHAMVAEVWDIEGAQAPPDPSGELGYFVTATYDPGGKTPSAFFDAWGGRGDITPGGARVLRDTEVVGAAIGTEAARLFASSGDGSIALPMIESALSLDPLSPSLRVVHATVLTESGGVQEGSRELEAAIELRPDGPRELALAQLLLAQAGMLEMTGQPGEASAKVAQADRIITEVVQKWPGYGRAHLALATIYLASDDAPRARIELQRAQELSPGSAMVWAGWAQYHLADGDPASASAEITRAVELDPQDWRLRLQAAHVLQAAGHVDAARASVSQALEMVPSDKRTQVRKYAEQLLGTDVLTEGAGLDLPDPVVAAPPPPAGGSNEPALILGDPSNLRLREPGQKLKLDLDQ